MIRFFIVAALLLFSAFSFAEIETEDEVTSPNEANLEITGTFSVMNPNQLVLSAREYQVSYSKNFFGISAFQLGLSVPTAPWGRFQIFPFARAGYARNQGTYSLTAPDGTSSTADVTLHWLPLSAGLRTEYSIPNFDLIRPYLLISGGAEWLSQQGTSLDLNETFWIPYYNVGLGLSFADTWKTNELGFGGFSFSINFQNGLRSDQETQLLSYDLTIHFLL